MNALMPSPIGHVLAGLAIGWTAERWVGGPARRNSASPRMRGRRPAAIPQYRPEELSEASRLALLCALIAAFPDIDLLLPTLATVVPAFEFAAGWHRRFTHSVGAAVLATIIAAAVTGWVTRWPPLRTALVCGAAYGSHVIMDWMGVDRSPPRGIQALWPFSDGWFISGWDLFEGTERRNVFSMAAFVTNLRAATSEIVIVGPVALAAWWLRRR